MTTRIAILGDFNPVYSTHHALNDSVRQITGRFAEELQFDWIATDIFRSKMAFKNLYAGLWIAPGSPYRDMQNVLEAITYARQNGIPTFGNCGGFQHMVIEFAKNVCGIQGAGHEETDPAAEALIIAKLACSLVEQQEQLKVIDRDSLLFRILQEDQFPGRYFCSYGINSQYLDSLRASGLKLTTLSEDGQVRAIELQGHPFFLGTLFQPALTSSFETPNPLILAFVQACLVYDRLRHSQSATNVQKALPISS